MNLIGKSAPTEAQLTDAATSFEGCELYLAKEHLDSFEDTVETCMNANISVEVVHTPHVSIDEGDYLLGAAELAKKLDARLVVHTSKIPLEETVEYFEGNVVHDDLVYGYEHEPPEDLNAIRTTLTRKNHRVVLDTAHLYLTASSPEDYRDQLLGFVIDHLHDAAVIHLTDASDSGVDNLPLGEGNVPLRWTIEQLSRTTAPVTVEVPRENQAQGKDLINSILQDV